MIHFGSCVFKAVALGWIPSCRAHSAYSPHAGMSLKNQPNQQKAKNKHPFILKYIKKKKKEKIWNEVAPISLYLFTGYSLCIIERCG